MLVALIGHRGSGKTRWLEIASQQIAAAFIDLDHVIETSEGLDISEIFQRHGEKYFRDLERKYFLAMYEKQKASGGICYLSIGAGFEFDLPVDVYAVWIQRETDLNPRIFLDRPRLNSEINPSQEYLERLEEREEKYKKFSDEVFAFPEGYPRKNEKDLSLVTRLNSGGKIMVNGIVKPPTSLLSNSGKFDFYLSRRRGWEGVAFEFRTDEFSPQQIKSGLNSVRHAVLSYRSEVSEMLAPQNLMSSAAEIMFDWAIELGECNFSGINIYSLHDRQDGEKLGEALQRLVDSAPAGALLKAAPMVNSFAELLVGFQWQQSDPENRSFLPRSADGRWQWFRVLMKGHQSLNYLREGRGEVLDQPLIFEWANYFNERNIFAAVLGDPITHSLTPSFQSEYFSDLGVPVLRIKVSKTDWSNGALNILAQLGLRYAAITSPLKDLVAQWIGEKLPVNTLYFDEGKKVWKGTNTDIFGIKKILEGVLGNHVAVWGGGGILPSIENELPDADFYHASTGNLRSGRGRKPDVLVWAVGRGHMVNGTWPPLSWQPHTVVDLNYSDDSPGREYALMTGSKYISGLEMFEEQGLKQREFWSQCEC